MFMQHSAIAVHPATENHPTCNIHGSTGLEGYDAQAHMEQTVQDRGIEAVRRIRYVCAAEGRSPRIPKNREALDRFVGFCAPVVGCPCLFCLDASLRGHHLANESTGVQEFIRVAQTVYCEIVCSQQLQLWGKGITCPLTVSDRLELCDTFHECVVFDITALDRLKQDVADPKMRAEAIRQVLPPQSRLQEAIDTAIAIFYKHTDCFASSNIDLYNNVRFELLHVLRSGRGARKLQTCPVCDFIENVPKRMMDSAALLLNCTVTSMTDHCILLNIKSTSASTHARAATSDAALFARACQAVLSASNSPLSAIELHQALNFHREKDVILTCAFEDSEVHCHLTTCMLDDRLLKDFCV